MNLRCWLLAALLLAIHWGVSVASVRSKSHTNDEVTHLTAGASYWRFNDYRLNPEGGMLAQRWAALGLLGGGFEFPDSRSSVWVQAANDRCGLVYFYDLGNDPQAMVWRGRAMVALLSTFMGLSIFVWSKALFGPGGGLISLLVFALSPTALAHGRLITADTCVSLFFLLATGTIWRLLHRITPLTVLAAGAACGGLLLSKMSGVLIGPTAVLLLVIAVAAGAPLQVGWRRMIKHRGSRLLATGGAAIVVALLTWTFVWAGYGFRYAGRSDAGRSESYNWSQIDRNSPIRSVALAAKTARILPEGYLYGFAYTDQRAAARASFLNGQTRLGGHASFFPYALLYKTPLPTMLLLLIATGALLSRRWPKVRLYGTIPLVVFAAVYTTFALRSPINIGHRHIMPIYGPMFVLVGAASNWLRWPPRLATLIVSLLLVSLAIVSIRIYPHYLAYFNTIAGGPTNGYRHLVDSSLDWGQDLLGLEQWLFENELDQTDKPPVYLSFFGSAEPWYYQIRARALPFVFDRGHRPREPFELTGGVYCISASMLQCVFLDTNRGLWCKPYEQQYQQLRRQVHRFNQTQDDPDARRSLIESEGRAYFEQTFKRFEWSRFARLCAYLRQREPDADVGHSILIYYLSDAQVHEALFGPPAELYETVQVDQP